MRFLVSRLYKENSSYPHHTGRCFPTVNSIVINRNASVFPLKEKEKSTQILYKNSAESGFVIDKPYLRLSEQRSFSKFCWVKNLQR
jgi:hypothetical protein